MEQTLMTVPATAHRLTLKEYVFLVWWNVGAIGCRCECAATDYVSLLDRLGAHLGLTTQKVLDHYECVRAQTRLADFEPEYANGFSREEIEMEPEGIGWRSFPPTDDEDV
jgi:hypothetical protein